MSDTPDPRTDAELIAEVRKERPIGEPTLTELVERRWQVDELTRRLKRAADALEAAQRSIDAVLLGAEHDSAILNDRLAAKERENETLRAALEATPCGCDKRFVKECPDCGTTLVETEGTDHDRALGEAIPLPERW